MTHISYDNESKAGLTFLSWAITYIKRNITMRQRTNQCPTRSPHRLGTSPLLCLAILLFADIAAGSPGSYEHKLIVNGYDRRALIYTPADTSVPTPVLFYFHGYSGTVEDSDSRRHFQSYWPEAIIVYAEGRYPYNADQELAGWRIRFPYIHKVCGESEDLMYIDKIMNHLRHNYVIDENRIFASGHSSGAFFTLSLMELKPDLFKGFAMLGAYSRYRVATGNLDCSDTKWTSAKPLELRPSDHAKTPRSVLYMFGALDNFDYDGPDALRSYSTSCNEDSHFRNTVDELLIRNHGTVPECKRERSDYIKKTTQQVFSATSIDGAETRIWLYGGGHGWEAFPEDANQVVVDFFRNLPPRWETNIKGNSMFSAWQTALQVGVPEWDKTVFADFNGDRRTDAFERRPDGTWMIHYWRNGHFDPPQDVGSAGDTLFDNMRFADFNGDGKTDVYRRLSGGFWQINYMGSNNNHTRFGPWHDVGSAGDTAIADTRFHDFNGNGTADVIRVIKLHS